MFALAFIIPSLTLTWCLDINPMESTDKYQGDIVLSPDAMKSAKQSHLKIDQFGGEPDATFGSVNYGHWPNGEVPYLIASNLRYESRATRAIQAAMNDYHKYTTCIRFKPRNGERNYIYFQNGGGCSSPVGMQSSGANVVTLASGCWSKGTVAHEIGHSLGFFHEQSRPDRDGYVSIYQQNIMNGMGFNFNKQKNIDSLGTKYDLSSMMHYSATAFSKNGQRTIVTKDSSKQHLIDTNNVISGFSQTDVKQLNLMYKCGTTKPTAAPNPNCKNSDSDCDKFARSGYCTESRGGWDQWMKNNCCKSCSSSCVDEHSNCQMWANRTPSECTNNPGYMLQKCKKSCKVC